LALISADWRLYQGDKSFYEEDAIVEVTHSSLDPGNVMDEMGM